MMINWLLNGFSISSSWLFYDSIPTGKFLSGALSGRSRAGGKQMEKRQPWSHGNAPEIHLIGILMVINGDLMVINGGY